MTIVALNSCNYITTTAMNSVLLNYLTMTVANSTYSTIASLANYQPLLTSATGLLGTRRIERWIIVMGALRRWIIVMGALQE